jgi:MFS transporter, Spinster family, sphingosine-1-phosphate transporter
VGGFSYWAPTFLNTRFGQPLGSATFTFGVVTVLAGGAATLIGARMAARVAAALPKTVVPADAEKHVLYALLRISAIGGFVAAPLAAACFLAPSAKLFFAFAFVCELGIFVSNAPLNLAMLKAVPAELRASAMSFCIMSIHLFGDLWSPSMIGKLADAAGDANIKYAMLPLSVAFAVSALAWWAKPKAAELTAAPAN